MEKRLISLGLKTRSGMRKPIAQTYCKSNMLCNRFMQRENPQMMVLSIIVAQTLVCATPKAHRERAFDGSWVACCRLLKPVLRSIAPQRPNTALNRCFCSFVQVYDTSAPCRADPMEYRKSCKNHFYMSEVRD